MSGPLDFVFLGLSITSSWGNGHATTYRALVRELVRRGHRVLFLERDVPWYATTRDLPDPPWGETRLYRSFDELVDRFATAVRTADVVVVGSYVPEGARVGAWVQSIARGRSIFYDIDTPVTLRDVERGACEYLTAELIPRYALYLSFTGGPALATLESRFGAPRARALYCSVDPETHFPPPDRAGTIGPVGATRADARWDLAYLGTYSDDRQPALEEHVLAPARGWPEGRFVVAGAQYPAIAWPANVARIDHIAPPDHPAFYGSARFALNLTRAAMISAGWSPSVRLFEAAACGTPILTDLWPGLETFFTPGRDVLVTRSAGETLGFLQRMPESERLDLARRGRTRVLADHTASRRAETLERWVRELLDARAGRRGAGSARAASEPS